MILLQTVPTHIQIEELEEKLLGQVRIVLLITVKSKSLAFLRACDCIWSRRKSFCHKGASKEINRTHKRVLRMLYEDYKFPFEILLTRSGSVCIHAKNLQKLLIEIYKSINHLSPSLVWEFHEKKCVEYNLRTENLCKLPTIKSTSFGLESLSFRGSFLWNTLDGSIKNELTNSSSIQN